MGVGRSRLREVTRTVVAWRGARTLVWRDGALFDVASGWTGATVDGDRIAAPYGTYGAGFDAVIDSPAGDVLALVRTAGTKALLLDGAARRGRLLREVDRSYYHADAYRYPLALFTLPDGRTGLAHCPEQYNRLEIEVAATGQRLTASAEREPDDFFHSRLAVSADGSRLLSAGWVWQPWGCLEVFDLVEALANPRILDGPGSVFDGRGLIQAEIAGACVVEGGVLLSTSAEENDPDGPDDLGPDMLARWSEDDGTFAWRRELDSTAGDLTAIGDHVLALHGHPRLFDPVDGELVLESPDIDTGTADSAIVWDRGFSGPARTAVDSPGLRFAVTDGDQVHIVCLGRT